MNSASKLDAKRIKTIESQRCKSLNPLASSVGQASSAEDGGTMTIEHNGDARMREEKSITRDVPTLDLSKTFGLLGPVGSKSSLSHKGQRAKDETDSRFAWSPGVGPRKAA
ncbi:hypothetical protein TSAR_000484 [Trichomalopsis sarcophagae]|uniref:Uncharacterized protein n=1 Tax=Trichomalopsis sarcophagae TaxID=543379 RepID=A0A232ENZ4_9HYME|nr:hypothetical protein TSAR_000484 [Trichomalopsis sarcophagae]